MTIDSCEWPDMGPVSPLTEAIEHVDESRDMLFHAARSLAKLPSRWAGNILVNSAEIFANNMREALDAILHESPDGQLDDTDQSLITNLITSEEKLRTKHFSSICRTSNFEDSAPQDIFDSVKVVLEGPEETRLAGLTAMSTQLLITDVNQLTENIAHSKRARVVRVANKAGVLAVDVAKMSLSVAIGFFAYDQIRKNR